MSVEKEKLDFLFIYRKLICNRKFIITTTLLSSLLLFLILLFIYPITYSANVKILPPEETKLGALGSLAASAEISGVMNLPGGGSNSQLYAEVLKSRSAAEYVIKKCSLLGYFGTNDILLAVSKLQRLIDVEVSKEGIITCNVDMSTGLCSRFSSENGQIRELSVKVANAYSDALDELNREKLNSKARRSREYIESQLENTKVKLDSTENCLRAYQEKNKTISISDQMTAAIETASKIKSEIIFSEIQIGTLSKNLNSQNDLSLDGLKTRLDELKKQYSIIEGGDKLNDDYLPGFKNIPKISLELARMVRDVKILNELYLLLQKNYFSESIQEKKDIPTVDVLDPAVRPLNAKAPRLVFHTMSGGLFVFFVCSFLVVYRSRKETL